MPPNRFESEVESFLEGSHGDRTHIKRADHPRLHHYAGHYYLRKLEVQKRFAKLYEDIVEYFDPIRDEVAGREVPTPVSPVLITKILMGTLGCVPAYDRFFVDGIKTYKVTTQEYSPKSVLKLVDFYEAHNDRLEEARRGMRTEDLTYPQMKLLDMGFWQIGFERDAGDAK